MLIFLSVWLSVHLKQIPSALAQADSLPTVTSPKTPLTARAIEQFRQIKRGMSMAQLKTICGEPDADIGSGLNIYLYYLSDGSTVTIGGGSTISYIHHVKPVNKIRNADRAPLLTTTRKFYQWNIDNAIAGLPSAQQISPVRDLLDSHLFTSLQQAKSIEACLIKAAPKDIKPAIFESNMFGSNYEGISKINNLSLSGQGNTAAITATLEYTDPNQLSTNIWVDKLVLNKKADRWLIEDIKFSQRTEQNGFLVSKTLTDILAGYIDKYQDACKS
jgi:hypothetical protein